MFYLLAGVLLIIAMIFIIWPIYGQIVNSSRSKVIASDLPLRKSTNIALYREQLDDLTKALADGGIEKAQYEQLKAELARNLLNDNKDINYLSVSEKSVSAEMASDKIINQESRQIFWPVYSIFIGGLLILPVLAILIYQYLGANDTEWKIAERLQYKNQLLQQPLPLDQSALEAINRELIDKLEDSLKNSPDNIQANLLHARIAVELRAFDEAITSYQRALKQQPQSSQIMTELAQALFISVGDRAKSVVETLSAKALAIDPNNVMALSLMGMVAFTAEKYAEAVDFWQRALALLPPNSTDTQILQKGIAQARGNLVMNSSSSAGDNDQDHQAMPSITVTVSLADNIDFQPEQAVFVYARAWKGSKMPLAIVKLQASQLPLTIVLNESMAMFPSMTLSSTGQLELVARLSLSGEAIPKAGDWQGVYGPVALSENGKVYPLVISQVVQ